MDRLNNIGGKLLIQSATFFAVCFSNYGHAGISGDGYWLIESGDSVYSIARNIFPDDANKRQKFRKQLIEDNAAIFKGNPGRINVGDRLALPAFAVSKPVKVEEKVEPVQTEAMPVPVAVAEEQAVPADPEDVIGHVVVSVGKMQASNRGTFRQLLRNSRILKGDTIKTAANAYTQLRMKDGALLSLRPNTEMVITDYHFDGKEDGTEKSFMELIRGGFRTITGYIGHKNKNNYRVRTSVATIGIRGTHYGLMICSQGSCSNEGEVLEDGVYGGVVDGSIKVSNDSGDYTFNNDQFFHVTSATSPATELLVPPPVFHGNNDRVYAKKEQNNKSEQTEKQHDWDKRTKREIKAALAGNKQFFPGEGESKKGHGNRLGTLVKSYIENKPQPLVLQDQVNDAVKDIPAFVPAPEGSAVLIALQGTDIINNAPDHIATSVFVSPVTKNEIILGSKLTSNGLIIKNIPVAIHEASNGQVHEVFLPSATADVNFIAGNPIGVNWGRWTGNYVMSENGNAIPTRGDLHYIYSDKITSPSQIAALGGLLSTRTYTLAGNTTPTDPAGNALKLGNLTITTDFIAQAMTQYKVVVNNVDGSPAFDMIKSAPKVPFLIPDANGNSMAEFDMISNPVANGGCTSCTGRASAAFVGNQAQGVITTYSMGDAADPSIGASGAAVLTRP